VSYQHKAASFLPYQPGIEFAPKPIKITNPKHEIRNPKQIRNDEKQKTYNVPSRRVRIQRFGFSVF